MGYKSRKTLEENAKRAAEALIDLGTPPSKEELMRRGVERVMNTWHTDPNDTWRHLTETLINVNDGHPVSIGIETRSPYTVLSVNWIESPDESPAPGKPVPYGYSGGGPHTVKLAVKRDESLGSEPYIVCLVSGGYG